ncbi:prostaglandin E synthase Su(P) [Lycorma delicatula]|uniref:prostaglandin E synthase Su(P) n=1 Tax=Lycorma delicatula TaxID=130591 RepID=UPI003F5102A6
MAAMWSYVYRCARTRLYSNLLSDVHELRFCNLSRIKGPVFYSSQSYQATKPKSRYLLIGLLSAGAGIIAGSTYSYYRLLDIRPIPSESKETISKLVHELPNVTISRKVVSPVDSTGLKLILFQYPTCPFCCKVRAVLDYYGLSYDVVEVNPVLRQQIKWSDYKKVPILLVRVDGGYQQLNDSSMIISLLGSYFHDKSTGIKELVKFYPTIEYHDADDRRKKEIMNRYFLMYQNISENTDFSEIKNVQKWRKWADEVLVHSLSPNVYRTREEALESFRWFSKVGEWERLFPAWEVSLIVYVGAYVMWIIGKRLKQRHSLKDDVRQSLYDNCFQWLKELKRKGTPYHGGSSPNLADLAVYGVLNSIEGCRAFQDLLDNTKIGTWYFSMKKLCKEHHGSLSLN